MKESNILGRLIELQSLHTKMYNSQSQYDYENRPVVKEARRVILEADKLEFISTFRKLWEDISEDIN